MEMYFWRRNCGVARSKNRRNKHILEEMGVTSVNILVKLLCLKSGGHRRYSTGNILNVRKDLNSHGMKQSFQQCRTDTCGIKTGRIDGVVSTLIYINIKWNGEA